MIRALMFLISLTSFCSGCSPGAGFGDKMTIWEAVEKEDLEYIEAYANRGKDLNVKAFRTGDTPLFHAWKLGRKKSFQKLLEMGANPNEMCRGGRIVVHYAAGTEDTFWLKEVLEAGGDPNIMNDEPGLKRGRPIYYAVVDGGEDRIAHLDIMLQYGADIDAAVDYRERDILTIACQSAEFQAVHRLLEEGADPNRTAIAEEESLIFTIRDMTPDVYKNEPHMHKWCQAVWDWLADHGIDPNDARWEGTKKQWIFH